jgi:hypothetical protein
MKIAREQGAAERPGKEVAQEPGARQPDATFVLVSTSQP